MAQFLCVVQADGSAAAATERLEAGLDEIHSRHFGAEPTDVSWW